MKKLVALFLATTLMFGTLTGCGGGKKTESGGDTGAAAPAGGSEAQETDGDVIVLKMGIIDPENSNYGQGALKIAEEVKEATNGKVRIELYAGAQLGNERDMFEGAQMGTIDICTAANSVMSGFIPEMAVLDQLFLFDNADQAHAAVDGTLGELIYEKAAEQGVHVVGWMESGFRDVFSSKPIEQLSDFKGVKLRTMENDIHIAAFNAMGAIATPMAAGDQYTALQQGTIDGAENAVANMLVNKFYEITKHITRTHHVFTFIGVGFSDKAWNQIPDDLKPVVQEAVQRGCNYQRQLLVEANEAAEVELKELGVEFHDIDTQSLKDAVAPAMEQFSGRMNPEWMAAIEEVKK